MVDCGYGIALIDSRRFPDARSLRARLARIAIPVASQEGKSD
jgi:hypothetical protein